MQAAQGFAELFDFGFGDVFFVLGLGELLGDFVEIAKNTFEGFADALHFLFCLQNPSTLFGRQIAVAGTAFLNFARRDGVGRSAMGRTVGAVGFPTRWRLVATAIARLHASIARGNATASASATTASMTAGTACAS